jgi:hypothetical protein
MDSHVMTWGVTALIVITVLFFVYLFLNYRASSTKPSPSSGSGGWTVYGSNKCGWTVKQTAEMDAKGVNYKFVDCDTENCEGISSFPTLKNDDGTVKVGFTPM